MDSSDINYTRFDCFMFWAKLEHVLGENEGVSTIFF